MKKALALFLTIVSICTLLTACGQSTLTDGTYRIEVTLRGGSGRASIDSPAKVAIVEDSATATIVWSSPYYEYMQLGDERFEPIQTDGNSTFEIPVILDEDMEVSACTVAMSEPHIIHYTLHFNSSTAKGE